MNLNGITKHAFIMYGSNIVQGHKYKMWLNDSIELKQLIML